MGIEKREIIKLLKENTFNTIGCTEVISIILAVSASHDAVGGKASTINLKLDKNLFKNAFSVIIPGTRESGLKLAAALGLTINDWRKGLLILEDINELMLSQAKGLLDGLDINIDLNYDTNSIYVEAEVITDNGIGFCLIEHKHDNIVILKKNSEYLIDEQNRIDKFYSLNNINYEPDIMRLLETINSLDFKDLAFIEKGININMQAARLGISEKAGLGLGYQYSKLINDGIIENNIINRAKMYVAGAADARMGGVKTSIVGCFGSGNHGITLFIPLNVMAEGLGSSRETLLKSIAFAEILTALVKKVTGLVTSHCGDILATGVGIAGGTSYLKGAEAPVIENSLQILIANYYGIICDGAKPTCALKIATAVQAGLESALLAGGFHGFQQQGVIGKNFFETLNNLEFLIKEEKGASDYHMIRLLEKRNSENSEMIK